MGILGCVMLRLYREKKRARVMISLLFLVEVVEKCVFYCSYCLLLLFFFFFVSSFFFLLASFLLVFFFCFSFVKALSF